MRIVQRLLFLLAILVPVSAGWAAQTSVRLILSHDVARPGDTIWAGLELRMNPGWHTYWENPGESGAATTVSWQLPDGVSAGPIQWPVPEKHVSGGLTTFVFHDEAMLLVPLTVSTSAVSGSNQLTASLRWLECEKVCIPGRGQVTAPLVVDANPGATARASAAAARLARAKELVPKMAPAGFGQAWWEGPADGDTRPLILEWTAPSATSPGAVSQPDFLPYAAKGHSIGPATTAMATGPGRVRVRKLVEKLEGNWPTAVAGLAVAMSEGRVLTAVDVVLAVMAAAPEVAGATAPSAALAGALPGAAVAAAAAGAGASAPPADAAPGAVAGGAAAAPTESVAVRDGGAGGAAGMGVLFLNLGLAFVGGLVLNLMPCVLPVLALKILGFVNQSGGSKSEMRRLGVIYGLGVLVSLLVLAGFIIAVKGTGKQASWGMQFQNPLFVVGMTTLVTLVALNLFGVFEVTLASGAMGRAGELASREGAAGAFFNGVLAVLLATPCTAPFLGVALGFALAPGVTASIIVAVFAMVGIGLAFPYVLLSFFPQFLKFVPKPGAWMEHFKHAMGFPMAATAVWLLTLTHAHYGRDGILWVGLFLVMLSLAVWVWGQFVQRGSRRRGFAAAIAVIILASGYGVALEGQLNWRAPGGRAGGAVPMRGDAAGIEWQPWSAAAVEQARKAGRPVFVDFTADWCITCQANKKTSIEIDSVRQRLKAMNALALLGDFTAEDETIARELQKYGRAGVPLVLVYPRDAAQPPIVLPELLTPAIVLDALDRAAR